MTSERDPNLAAGIGVVIFGGIMLLCLAGSLVLPTNLVPPRWVGYGLLAVLLSIPVLGRLAHRSRIRLAVRGLGGEPIRIRRLPFWRQEGFPWFILHPWWVNHRVEYVDLMGIRHRALCRSGWSHGVEWLEDVVYNRE